MNTITIKANGYADANLLQIGDEIDCPTSITGRILIIDRQVRYDFEQNLLGKDVITKVTYWYAC